MKHLETEFKSNVDTTGLQTFKRIKYTADAAIYQRIRSDGTTHSYEAFRIKVVKAGASLPNGLKVLEDYVKYPTKNDFGKWAYSCKTLEQAEQRYEQIIKEKVNTDTSDADPLSDDSESIKSETVKQRIAANGIGKSNRGRKAKDRSKIKMPAKGERFDMKQLHAMNSDMSFAFVYQHLRSLLGIEYQIIDSVTGGRGKPRIIYQSM